MRRYFLSNDPGIVNWGWSLSYIENRQLKVVDSDVMKIGNFREKGIEEEKRRCENLSTFFKIQKNRIENELDSELTVLIERQYPGSVLQLYSLQHFCQGILACLGLEYHLISSADTKKYLDIKGSNYNENKKLMEEKFIQYKELKQPLSQYNHIADSIGLVYFFNKLL